MSSAGDANSPVSTTKDEADEKADTVEDLSTLPSASQITSEMMQNPQVLAALQQRLDSIVGTPSGYIESLPKPIKQRVNALKNLQVESVKIEAKFYEEVHELERKYNALYLPLYEKRESIITGTYEPTAEECEWHSEEEEDDDEEGATKKNESKEKKLDDSVKIEENEEEVGKGIPEFWLTILKNVQLFQEMVQEHDEPILAKLQDIKVSFSQPNEPMGFTLEFVFDANPYFTNKSLTKYYRLQSQPDEKDPFSFEGPEIVSCTGCKIDWAKGKNVTVKTVKKKQKHKGRGTVRTVSKQIPNDSFFNFFNPPEVPEDDADMDSDTEALLTSDFEIGHMMRDRIVPRAVLYFTGEAGDEDFDDEEDEDEDDDDDEDDEDRLNNTGDSDDSEGANDSDYDPEKDPKAKDTPQECKQQ